MLMALHTEIPSNRIPHYLRQRLLLALLQEAGGILGKMDFQKLLFLVHQESNLSHFDFVPYRYGCYSFQAASDLKLLERQGWLTSSEKTFSVSRCLPCGSNLPQDEQEVIRQVMCRHADKRGETLVQHVYTNYPYYAIHSEMTPRLLDKAQRKKIDNVRSVIGENNRTTLFTIGYEGLSLETYMNKLITKGVKLLCDVRRNPLSRKFGFSKRTLAHVLPQVGIDYHHVPELGIESSKRLSLNTIADYKHLFAGYRLTLPKRTLALMEVYDLLKKHKRVALTCFEKEPHYCHRRCVSDYLAISRKVNVVHL